FPAPVVSKEMCQEIALLLSAGVSTDQSKLVSKEFPRVDEPSRARENTLKTVNSSEEALIKTQLKIMDIGPPLIDLYARVVAVADDTPAGVRSRRSLQAALQQWGRAYAHISRKRREAIVNATDPRVDYLLKDETVFTRGKEAREHLFTGEFLELMLKEASQDETLARRDQAAAAASRGRRNPIRMAGYGNSSGSSAPRVYGDDFEPTARGRGRGRGGHGRGVSRGRYETSISLASVSPAAPIFCNGEIGARLSLFSERWGSVTRDPWVLDTVTNGLRISFISQPIQRMFPREVVMSEEMKAVCDAEVASLLAKKAITAIEDDSVGFVCSFFCIP
ncbi:Uncharacterized protein APZ42_006941, partial [Daphnia magna]